MAQLSGFTKAFNMSMNNMLTFAQMRQGQEAQKAELDFKKRQQGFSLVSAAMPMIKKGNPRSVQQQGLDYMAQGMSIATGKQVNPIKIN